MGGVLPPTSIGYPHAIPSAHPIDDLCTQHPQIDRGSRSRNLSRHGCGPNLVRRSEVDDRQAHEDHGQEPPAGHISWLLAVERDLFRLYYTDSEGEKKKRRDTALDRKGRGGVGPENSGVGEEREAMASAEDNKDPDEIVEEREVRATGEQTRIDEDEREDGHYKMCRVRGALVSTALNHIVSMPLLNGSFVAGLL